MSRGPLLTETRAALHPAYPKSTIAITPGIGVIGIATALASGASFSQRPLPRRLMEEVDDDRRAYTGLRHRIDLRLPRPDRRGLLLRHSALEVLVGESAELARFRQVVGVAIENAGLLEREEVARDRVAANRHLSSKLPPALAPRVIADRSLKLEHVDSSCAHSRLQLDLGNHAGSRSGTVLTGGLTGRKTWPCLTGRWVAWIPRAGTLRGTGPTARW